VFNQDGQANTCAGSGGFPRTLRRLSAQQSQLIIVADGKNTDISHRRNSVIADIT